MAEHRAGELGKEAIEEIKPRAVLGCEHELEAACALLSEPAARFFRDVRGMIVEDEFDRGVCRVGRIEQLEEFDELATTVAVPHQRIDLSA